MIRVATQPFLFHGAHNFATQKGTSFFYDLQNTYSLCSKVSLKIRFPTVLRISGGKN